MARRAPPAAGKARLAAGLLGLACALVAGCATQDVLLPENQGLHLELTWKQLYRPLAELPPDVRMKPVYGEIDGVPVAYLAGSDRVWAADLSTGDAVWELELELGILVSSGMALQGDNLYLALRNGDILALDPQDGGEKFRTYVQGEVITPVAATDERVVVRTAAGLVLGLDPRDGAEVWRTQLDEPRLTLRGNASPVLRQSSVLILTDACRLVGLQLDDGTRLFNVALSAPKGITELDRLVDGDSTPVAIAGSVYTSCYKGEMRALDLVRSNVAWSADVSSLRDLLQEGDSIFVVGTEGVVSRIHRGSGRDLWRQQGLGGRNLSHPALWNDWIALGDFQGYVHFLSREDGEILGRIRPLCGPGKLPNSRVCAQIRELVPTPEGLLALSDGGWAAVISIP